MNKMTLLFGLIVMLTGCTQKESLDAKKIAEDFRVAWNGHDISAVAKMYAPDAVMIGVEPEPVQGREAIQKGYESFLRAFPDLTMSYTHIFADQDHFIVEGISKGTNTGPMMTPDGEIPATGRTINLRFAFFAKLNSEGLIVEDRTYSDNAEMMSQLGLN